MAGRAAPRNVTRPFGISLAPLEAESEHFSLLSPAIAAARVKALTYAARLAASLAPEHTVFAFERSMRAQPADLRLAEQLCLATGHPYREGKDLSLYLCGASPALVEAYPEMGATMPGGGYAQNGGYGQGGQVPYGGPATQQLLHNQFGHLPAHAMHGHATQVQPRQHSPLAANQSPMMSSTPMNSPQGQPAADAPHGTVGAVSPALDGRHSSIRGHDPQSGQSNPAVVRQRLHPYAGLSMRRSVPQVTNTCRIGTPVASSKCHRPFGVCDAV